MQIGVYSLKKVLFRGEAREITCHTKSGEITILDHHEPLISILGKGVMKIVDDAGKEHFVPVQSGFLEVRANNQARFLVEEAVEVKHI